MPNIIQVPVDEIDDILNAGAYGAGALVHLQTSDTETGVYADVSGTGSTPTIALVAGTRLYTGFDPNGTISSWYRTRYENAGASRASDWSSPSFQVGDEGGGLLCSTYDVEQELGTTLSANDRENVLDKIGQVSAAIRDYTHQTFLPDPRTGTTVRLYDGFDAMFNGQRLPVPEGIISLASVELAQFTTGTFLTVPVGQWFLRPLPQQRFNGRSATELWLTNFPTSGSIFQMYPGFENIRLTGQFGWAKVPADIEGVAIRATARRYIGKGAGGVSVAVGPAGTEILLPDMSGADKATLMRYREPVVG